MIVIPVAVNDKTFVSSVSGRNSRREEWLAPPIHQSEWSNHQGVRYCMCLWVSAIVLTGDVLCFQERSVTTKAWGGPARTSASSSAGWSWRPSWVPGLQFLQKTSSEYLKALPFSWHLCTSDPTGPQLTSGMPFVSSYQRVILPGVGGSEDTMDGVSSQSWYSLCTLFSLPSPILCKLSI